MSSMVPSVAMCLKTYEMHAEKTTFIFWMTKYCNCRTLKPRLPSAFQELRYGLTFYYLAKIQNLNVYFMASFIQMTSEKYVTEKKIFLQKNQFNCMKSHWPGFKKSWRAHLMARLQWLPTIYPQCTQLRSDINQIFYLLAFPRNQSAFLERCLYGFMDIHMIPVIMK